MIETTEDIIEGARFLRTRICEPYEYEKGVRVEKVSYRVLTHECAGVLRLLGLRKVGEEPWTDCAIYAHYPIGYAQYKVVHFLLRGYWWAIRFLYRNARMFQEISPADKGE